MEKEEKMTEEQVIETLEAFSKALDLNFERTGKPFDFQSFSTNFDDYRTGAYTPSSQQQLMKHININTVAPDKRNIEEALKDPAANEDNLVSYNQSFYFESIFLYFFKTYSTTSILY